MLDLHRLRTLVGRLLGTEDRGKLPVPNPAELARELVNTATGQGLAQLRRLYAKPDTGERVAADSRSTAPPAPRCRVDLRYPVTLVA